MAIPRVCVVCVTTLYTNLPCCPILFSFSPTVALHMITHRGPPQAGDEAFQRDVTSRLPLGKIGKPIMSSRGASERKNSGYRKSPLRHANACQLPPRGSLFATTRWKASFISRLRLCHHSPKGKATRRKLLPSRPQACAPPPPMEEVKVVDNRKGQTFFISSNGN